MLTSPGLWLAAACALGVILTFLWPRLGPLLAGSGALGLVLIATLPIDQWLLAPLENRFPARAEIPKVAGIIMLGGGIDTGLTADRGLPSLNAAAERLTRFAALARQNPEVKLVFTGGPTPNQPDGRPETEGTRAMLASLGIDVGRIIFEPRSTTTWENAVFSRALVQPKPDEVWLLVTSAAHMPRSVGAFRQAGWQVQADPVGYKSFAEPQHRGRRGFGERLALIDIAAHEWIGLLAYDMQGRSSALFPEP